MKLPLRICSICEKNLQFFRKFKQDCVENSLRLEAKINEAQNITDLTKKCSTSETNINNLYEVYIKDEVVHEIDNLDVKYSLNEISLKEDPMQENSYDREVVDELQETLKKESLQETHTRLHEDSSIDMDDEREQNSDDPDFVISDNNEINFDENIVVTSSAGSKIYTCLICKKDFKRLWYLKNHMKDHLGKKDFQCNECKKWFTRKSNLVTHMKQHSGFKDFQCNECKKWFLLKAHLTRHMKQHTGVKDFQCNECKKWFTQKSTLVTHIKEHTGIKNHQCNECKKWFTRKSSLGIHMKLHTGLKDFQCNECKKWFSQKSHLIAHLKQHTEIKNF